MNKLVSVITPVYNSSSYIYETYNSLLSQTYKNWEWLVTDDCSSDDTYQLLMRIKSNDNRVKVFKNKTNSGAAVSRNNSLENASGDYIAFLDSDDIWFSNKLDSQIAYMIESKVFFSFTAYRMIDSEGSDLSKTVDTHLSSPLTYDDMLKKKATLGCSTVMLDRNHFGDIKMPLIRTGQDYALWLNLLKNKELAYPMSTILTKYRITPNSISRNKVLKAKRQWTIYRELEKLTLTKSVYCFFFYAYRAVFRK